MNPMIETLCDTNTGSVVEALAANDLTLIRMSDGSRPTDDQLQHILSATSDDWQEAVKEVNRRAESVNTYFWAAERSHDIFVKYALTPKEAIEDVLPRMSNDDRQEFIALTNMMLEGNK